MGARLRIASGPAVLRPRNVGRTHDRTRPRRTYQIALASTGSSTHDTWCPALGSVCGVNPPFPFVSSRRFCDPHPRESAGRGLTGPSAIAAVVITDNGFQNSALRAASCSFGCIAARYRSLLLRRREALHTDLEIFPEGFSPATNMDRVPAPARAKNHHIG